VVITGWLFNIALFESIHTAGMMKFDSAIVFCPERHQALFHSAGFGKVIDKAQVVLSVTSLIIMLLMGILFFSVILNIHTGAEELFMKDTKFRKNGGSRTAVSAYDGKFILMRWDAFLRCLIRQAAHTIEVIGLISGCSRIIWPLSDILLTPRIFIII